MAESVVADSSFYICFLDDVGRPDFLLKIIHNFDFFIGKIVKNEIEKSKNFFHIRNVLKSKSVVIEYENFGELLKPFFSISEVMKGEQEVIAIAIIMFTSKPNLVVILDETGPRNFVTNNFPELSEKMVGTVGFLKHCCCNYRLFSVKETIKVLELIRKSNFRIEDTLIERTINDVKGCLN